jgi:hypothetical protein
MSQSQPIGLNSIVAQAERLLSTKLDGETILMSLERSAYYGLDTTAQRIWSLIATPCRVADLCDQLIAEYAVQPEACRRDVPAFLAELSREGLVRLLPEGAA